MLLGECLAAALTRSATYRQVAQRFLDIAEREEDTTVLLFVLARNYSKLSEIDLSLVDTSVLVRIASQLDAKQSVSGEDKAVEGLLGRVLGKLRGTPAGDLLIRTFSKGGRSSRIAAIGGISLTYHRAADEPVFYLSELENIHEKWMTEEELHQAPPSPRMLGLLSDIDLWQHQDVGARVRLAKQEIEQDFPGIEFPYGYSWSNLQEGILPTNLFQAPFMGTVVKVTRANMVEQSGKVGVSTIACLTESRIVDALFRDCGALLIPEQDADSHQCGRLRGRSVPYAMLSAKTMASLSDEDVIAVDRPRLSLWRRLNNPDWPQRGERKPVRRPAPKPEPKLRTLQGANKLVQETVVPHLAAMAGHIDRPLRLNIVIKADGCEDSEWTIDFESGSMRVAEGTFNVNVILRADVDAWPELIQQKLTSDNTMNEVWGDMSYFPTLFDAWNAALGGD